MDKNAVNHRIQSVDIVACDLSVDDYLSVIRPILRGIAQTFGRYCEVVLHDFRDPEHSIVAIEGNVTNRKPGGSVTQIGLALIADGDAAQDSLNYITRTPTGRVLKSSTVLLRDRDNRVFGALCINFDITEIRLMESTIGELAGSATETEPQPIAFVDDVNKVIRAVIDEEEIALGISIDRMTKQDRLAIFEALNRRGIFRLQRSVTQVAEYLQISRATAYSYLEEVRSGELVSRLHRPPPDS
ncbi:MAG: helix-turn-helix transcriptional regulator [Thermomicrobiales bacterium]